MTIPTPPNPSEAHPAPSPPRTVLPGQRRPQGPTAATRSRSARALTPDADPARSPGREEAPTPITNTLDSPAPFRDDTGAAREAYLEALGAAIFAGRLSRSVGPREVA